METESGSEAEETVEETSEEEDEEEEEEEEEEETECAGGNVTVSKAGLEMREVACQCVGTAVESVETWCDLVGEEMRELADRLKLKSDECELINGKFLDKVDLVEKMTSEARHMENGKWARFIWFWEYSLILGSFLKILMKIQAFVEFTRS